MEFVKKSFALGVLEICTVTRRAHFLNLYKYFYIDFSASKDIILEPGVTSVLK